MLQRKRDEDKTKCKLRDGEATQKTGPDRTGLTGARLDADVAQRPGRGRQHADFAVVQQQHELASERAKRRQRTEIEQVNQPNEGLEGEVHLLRICLREQSALANIPV